MSDETNKKVVPSRRFKRFNNADPWIIEPMGEVYSFKVTNSFSRDQLTYESGETKNIHYGDIHTKFQTLFDITKEHVPFINDSISLDKINSENYCVEGDMVFADASEDLKDVGKSIELVNLNSEQVLSGLHTLLARQKESKLVVGIGGYLFTSPAIRSQIQREAQGSKVLGISATRLSNITIYYPEDKAEQQKIATCLSSLDELITAERQKLDALKAHKKGLMQQLFPAEGETVPKLRFAEFTNSGEWMEKTLTDVCKMQAGKFVSASEINEVINDDLFPCYGGNGLRGFTKSFTHNGIYSLIGRQGALCGNVTLAKGQFHATEHAVVVTPKEQVDTLWLFYQLNFLDLNQYATGQAQPGLSVDNLEKVELQIPKLETEQQKIASCLSSIDELITAKSVKIEALKVHKKGLMQQLFPQMSELNSDQKASYPNE
jgi:type I restriction enzyme, S subunit